MSIILKICLIAFAYAFISVLLRSYRPEYVFFCRVCAIAIVFILISEDLAEFLTNILAVFNVFNIESEHINLLIKVTGIAIITDFVCDTLNDTGDRSMAGVISVASKFLIIYMALPILNGLVMFCMKFIE